MEYEYGMTVNQIALALATLSDGTNEPVLTINENECIDTVWFIQSWRGSYDEPSIRIASAEIEACLNDVQKQLSRILQGETFTGFKGGEFVYTGDQILRVTRHGEETDRRIVRVSKSDDGIIFFHTQVFDWS